MARFSSGGLQVTMMGLLSGYMVINMLLGFSYEYTELYITVSYIIGIFPYGFYS